MRWTVCVCVYVREKVCVCVYVCVWKEAPQQNANQLGQELIPSRFFYSSEEIPRINKNQNC